MFRPCTDYGSLRRDTQTLVKLREQMAILWGDLEELKLAALQKQQPFPPSEATSAEDMRLSNLPFYCCIEEYGQELDEEDRPDEFSAYTTLYAMTSTRIFESGASDASN
jgi:protection-of-telomeres protein 1